MSTHSEKLLDIIRNDLHEWAKEFTENSGVDALLKARALGPFGNAVRQLEAAAEIVGQAEVEVEPE